MVQYQLGALEGFLKMEGLKLNHVKCHGALYNRSIKHQVIADALVEAVARYRPDLPIYGFPYSCVEHAAAREGRARGVLIPCLSPGRHAGGSPPRQTP